MNLEFKRSQSIQIKENRHSVKSNVMGGRSSILDNYLNSISNKGTRETYAYALKTFFGFMRSLKKGKNVFDLKRSDFDGYREYLKKRGYAPKSVYNLLSVVSHFFFYLVKEDYMVRSPCDHLDRGKNPKGVFTEPISEETFFKLINSIDRSTPKGRLYFAIYVILGSVGMRIGNLSSLTCGSFCKGEDSMELRYINLKSNRPMIKKLPSITTHAIQDHLKDRGCTDPCTPLISSLRTIRLKEPSLVKEINRSTVLRDLERRLDSIGELYHEGEMGEKVKLKLHSFRVMYITKGLEQFDIGTIQREAGHSSIEMTSLYDKRRNNASKEVGEFILGNLN